MKPPSHAEILSFIAASEPLERTLAKFPGLTREQIRALLREAAVLVQADERGVPEQPAAPALPERAPAPRERPPREPASPPGRRPDEPAPAAAGPARPSPAPEPGPGPGPGPGPRRLRLYSDGAARGNPGPAGAGAVLTKTDGTVVAKSGKYLGVQTNNFAEYTALLLGLETALRLGANEIEVYADSELLVRQLQGRYKVRSPGLRPLHERARELLGRFRDAPIHHVPREQNKAADEMSNRAIDERMA